MPGPFFNAAHPFTIEPTVKPFAGEEFTVDISRVSSGGGFRWIYTVFIQGFALIDFDVVNSELSIANDHVVIPTAGGLGGGVTGQTSYTNLHPGCPTPVSTKSGHGGIGWDTALSAPVPEGGDPPSSDAVVRDITTKEVLRTFSGFSLCGSIVNAVRSFGYSKSAADTPHNRQMIEAKINVVAGPDWDFEIYLHGNWTFTFTTSHFCHITGLTRIPITATPTFTFTPSLVTQCHGTVSTPAGYTKLVGVLAGAQPPPLGANPTIEIREAGGVLVSSFGRTLTCSFFDAMNGNDFTWWHKRPL